MHFLRHCGKYYQFHKNMTSYNEKNKKIAFKEEQLEMKKLNELQRVQNKRPADNLQSKRKLYNNCKGCFESL